MTMGIVNRGHIVNIEAVFLPDKELRLHLFIHFLLVVIGSSVILDQPASIKLQAANGLIISL